jgi:hypothetical protein
MRKGSRAFFQIGLTLESSTARVLSVHEFVSKPDHRCVPKSIVCRARLVRPNLCRRAPASQVGRRCH